MATKNHPGKFDCYQNAELDEPMFVLLARDELASHLVRAWAHLRMGEHGAAVISLNKAYRFAKEKPPMDPEKYLEAITCANAMEEWSRVAHSPTPPRVDEKEMREMLAKQCEKTGALGLRDWADRIRDGKATMCSVEDALAFGRALMEHDFGQARLDRLHQPPGQAAARAGAGAHGEGGWR